MTKLEDLTGRKFGRLTVIKRVENHKSGKTQWLCRCECGTEKIIPSVYLKSGDTKSCGCLATEVKKQYEDLTGMKFNKLTVIKRIENNKFNQVQWLCKCDCGNEIKVTSNRLKLNKCKSCGCGRIKEDLTGQKFGRLTVLRQDYNKNSNNYWLCKCDCGNIKSIRTEHLKDGSTVSCGCYSREITSKRSITHNKTKTRLYRIWISMKCRCYDEKHETYKNYGGRGIKICDEWLSDFMNFYNWAMENGYDENAPRNICTIDRIDVNGNYEPDNCRFVDMKVQQNNRRNNHYITYNGETHTMKQWAEILNISTEAIRNRLKKYDYNIEKVFTQKKYAKKYESEV